ncbi:MAG: HDOD domain-containing protein, partial [Gammaproteobacteria bacterium]
ERFFVAGLLHDIGILVMYSQLDGHVADMRAELDGGEHTLHAAELERFEFSHACVGAEVLAQWGLPASLLSGVRFHHVPAGAQTANHEAALISLADRLSNQSSDHSLHPAIEPEQGEHGDALRILGVDSATFNATAIVERSQTAFSQAMRNLMP